MSVAPLTHLFFLHKVYENCLYLEPPENTLVLPLGSSGGMDKQLNYNCKMQVAKDAHIHSIHAGRGGWNQVFGPGWGAITSGGLRILVLHAHP